VEGRSFGSKETVKPWPSKFGVDEGEQKPETGEIKVGIEAKAKAFT